MAKYGRANRVARSGLGQGNLKREGRYQERFNSWIAVNRTQQGLHSQMRLWSPEQRDVISEVSAMNTATG